MTEIELLYRFARDENALGEAGLRSWSGADQADSELHFGASRVYVSVSRGTPLEEAIAKEDARWRAYADEQARKVNAAPRIKRGPSQGQSVIGHRWVNPDGFGIKAIHIRAMVRIAKEHAL
jgi:hypothetical protein